VIAHDGDPKGQLPMGRVVLKTGEAIAEAGLQQLTNLNSNRPLQP